MSPNSNNNGNNNNNPPQIHHHHNKIIHDDRRDELLVLPKEVTDPPNLPEALIIGAATSMIFLYLNVYFREKYNKPLKNDEYGARIISLIHAVISSVACGYALLTHSGGFFDTVNATRMESDALMFSFAYFFVDSIIMFMWKFDMTYFMHHVVTMAFTGYAAFGGKYGFATAFATFGGEVTNPIMHLRWLVHANDAQQAKTPGPLMKFLTMTWFVLFFFMRFFGAPWVVFYMVTLMPIYFSPLAIGIMVMSWKFFVDAVKSEIKDPFNAPEAMMIGAASSAIFLYLNILFKEKFNKPLKNDEYGARLLSLIHAVISSIGCGYALLTHDGGFLDTRESTRIEANICMFSFAYFFVDTLVMFMWKFDAVFVLHHIVTLSFTGITAFGGHNGFLIAFSIFGGELTNPFMHGRWLIHANDPQQAKAPRSLMKFLTKSWFVLFFIVRFLLAPIATYYVIVHLPIFFPPLCTGLMVMSWKFFFDVLKIEMKGEWWTG